MPHIFTPRERAIIADNDQRNEVVHYAKTIQSKTQCTWSEALRVAEVRVCGIQRIAR